MRPKTALNLMDCKKFFATNLAEAAGINSILNTRTIPTVCKEPTIARDNTIKNK